MSKNTKKSLDTFPKLLAENARKFPREIAIREKKYGIWKCVSWSEYHENVKQIACGLSTLGVKQGDVVGLIGDNRPNWVAGQIASHALGAVSIGFYRDMLEDELCYLLNYSGAKIIFAEDEEQVDKILSLGAEVSGVEYIVFDDSRGMRKYRDPRLINIERLRRGGVGLLDATPDFYDEIFAKRHGDEVAIFCTTSGTTSRPKLAMLSANCVLKHTKDFLGADPKGAHDEYVSLLPLSWIMEQVNVFGKSLVSRMKVNFVEEPETMMADLREIGPTFVLFSPALWDGIAADIRSKMMDASWFKRKMYNIFTFLGLSAIEKGKRSWLAERFLYSALKDRIGLSNVKSAITGGAPLSDETSKFYGAMGVPVQQLYGQTETIGAFTYHKGMDIDTETVGKPFNDNIKVKIVNPDKQGIGEIIVQHENMFLGYYKDEAAKASVMKDGWLYTGDAGYINDKKRLIVLDRLKDLAELNGGVRFSPQYIENKLKFSPYISQSVIVGAGQSYLSAIICIRYSIVSKWAEKNRLAFTTYTDLSTRPEVYELIRKEVEDVNERLPQNQKIKKFVLLYKELDADDGELTRTGKIRRNVISDLYQDIIMALYSDQEKIDIDKNITFQDGSNQRVQTAIAIERLEILEPLSKSMAAE